MDSQRLLLPRPAPLNDQDEGEEDWSDDSSYSYYSDSDSTIPDWEPYIDDFTGELLYIDCHPFVTQNSKILNKNEQREPFTKNQLRQSTRGKFLRLIRRRDTKRHSKKNLKPEPNDTTKVKFQDFQEGEEKEVLLDVDKDNKHNLRSDVSLAESLLGLNVSTLSDGSRVMIAGFSYDSKAKNERNIKIGDWLKSINGIEVDFQSLEDVLQKFINRDKVLLKLQRVAGIEVTKDPPINELNNESLFVKELLNKTDNELLLQTLCKHPIGIIYLNTEKLSETAENQDIIYCFPKPSTKSPLFNSRGIFITLNHLLKEVTQTSPRTSSIKYKGRLSHIVYSNFNEKLLLFQLPDNRASLKETKMINEELITILRFTYGSLDKCFEEKTLSPQIDHFFSRFFARILSSGLWATAQQFVELHSLSTKSLELSPMQFEDALPAATLLNLPDEAQIQIDDALTELEASDYRDWNEEPLDCQRLFTILGSALYHSGYLLGSHLPHQDLIDIHCFCRQQGLLHLSKTEPVKNLILWREVFPTSETSSLVEDSRHYLLVVGSSKNLLAVLMEAGGCTEPAEDNMGPDAFYVEEAQATLAHIQELGIPELTDRWLATNQGTQLLSPIPTTGKRKNDLLLPFRKEPSSPKKNEVTSILKRRSCDQVSFNSDDLDGQSQGSGYSEISDESRRRYDDDEEDSDFEAEGSQLSTSSFDISELRQTLLSETEGYKPIKLTSGNENILFHFVQLDLLEGVLLAPPENRPQSSTLELILNNFRRCCQKIHSLFENTLRFKNMPAPEMAKTVMNKSLIAIKEHGIVFECPFLEDKEKSKISYWVVGRLFYMPHPREVYVCYQDGIPQNLVEIAFKINIKVTN